MDGRVFFSKLACISTIFVEATCIVGCDAPEIDDDSRSGAADSSRFVKDGCRVGSGRSDAADLVVETLDPDCTDSVDE